MNILLIGGGGREHALAWKIAQSRHCDRLYAAPGNPGIARHAESVKLDIADHAAVAAFCRDRQIGLVVVGPEAPLVAGLVDSLTRAGIRAFGPTAAAARLEGSKGFTKDLCAEFGIPTAAYRRFDNGAKAKAWVARQGAPIVVKADGLAAGKGVTVAASIGEAVNAIDECFTGAFGGAGGEVVVEEFLQGEEASLFALCDGRTALLLGTARDHKRAGDGDTGPNTGGMGAVSPAANLDAATTARVMNDIVVPTLAAMHHRGHPFVGILYAGLMLTRDGPKLIEYNVRFGDPECQVLMPRLKSDLVELMLAALDGELAGAHADWREEAAVCVVMAAKGYPGRFETGSPIGGLADAQETGALVFQAGTAELGGRIVAAGGRVLGVTALGRTAKAARAAAYAAVDRIDWPQGFCRRDIGGAGN
jgi:phosphoribosylamine--glycine ligase